MAEKYKIEFEVDSSGAVKSVEKVDDALKDTGKTAKKELSAIEKGVKKVGQAGKTIASGGLKAIGLGLRGIGKAYLAAGIGIIVSGFTFLYNALNEQKPIQEILNKYFFSFPQLDFSTAQWNGYLKTKYNKDRGQKKRDGYIKI